MIFSILIFSQKIDLFMRVIEPPSSGFSNLTNGSIDLIVMFPNTK